MNGVAEWLSARYLRLSPFIGRQYSDGRSLKYLAIQRAVFLLLIGGSHSKSLPSYQCDLKKINFIHAHVQYIRYFFTE